mgnify:FL=1
MCRRRSPLAGAACGVYSCVLCCAVQQKEISQRTGYLTHIMAPNGNIVYAGCSDAASFRQGQNGSSQDVHEDMRRGPGSYDVSGTMIHKSFNARVATPDRFYRSPSRAWSESGSSRPLEDKHSRRSSRNSSRSPSSSSRRHADHHAARPSERSDDGSSIKTASTRRSQRSGSRNGNGNDNNRIFYDSPVVDAGKSPYRSTAPRSQRSRNSPRY